MRWECLCSYWNLLVNTPRIVTVVIAPLVAGGLLLAALSEAKSSDENVFDQPRIQQRVIRLQSDMVSLALQKKTEESLAVANRILALTPQSPTAHYNVACLLAITGRKREALISLRESVRLGFRNPQHIESDSDLAALRDDPQFAGIVEQSRKPFVPPEDHLASPAIPEPIREGVAMVNSRNTRWSDSAGSLESVFETAGAVNSESNTNAADSPADLSPAEAAVRRWVKEGTAAGHPGDLYDNRDRDHSNLDSNRFPGLTRVEYGPDAQSVKADWGVQLNLMFDRPTIGNSSTSHVGTPFWRSNPRVIQGDDHSAKLAYNQYVHNQMYVYPEHNDFDPEHGDVYPGNIPFCVVSQGSSGSDQPFLKSLVLTMAAFRPETKQKLVAHGLLMPTVQAIFRRCGRSVVTDDDYLSGKTHPMVFQEAELDPMRMIQMAHEMPHDRVPAVVQLRVVEEDLGVPGRDYFHPAPAEKLFDTPVSVARLYRTVAGQRRMVVDASHSADLNGRPLTFRWVVLQGDPQRVEIRMMNAVGSKAEIRFHWHERFPVAAKSEIQSNRVDVGVFAHNGHYYSAPAFVSSFTFDNEKREYDEQGRIRFVDYGDPVQSRRYVDPAFDLSKKWRDDYAWSESGELLGWTRTMPDASRLQFHSDGTLVVRRDELDRVVESKPVRYMRKGEFNTPGILEQQIADQAITYQYSDDKDRNGQIVLPVPEQQR